MGNEGIITKGCSMKWILFVVVPFLLVTNAEANSVVFEIGIGIGSSGNVTKTEKEMRRPYNVVRWCVNRPSSRLKFVGVRYRQGDVEAHYARWWHDSKDRNCDRTSNAVGLGLVLQTGGSSYASWTPGIAYTWGSDKDFTNEREDNTNWRLSNNFQVFNRLAIGLSPSIEFAYTRYGLKKENAETFATVGFLLTTADSNSTPAEEPPVSDPPDDDTPTKERHCNNGGGNGSEGCNASDNGNDDEE